MLKKFGISMLAVVLAATFSAFTAPAKEETALKTADLYWYKVHGNQINSSSDLQAYGPKASITSPCNAGTSVDCLRGFEQQLDFSSGAVTAMGSDRIKTNQQVP